jgi:hypothetical protein
MDEIVEAAELPMWSLRDVFSSESIFIVVIALGAKSGKPACDSRYNRPIETSRSFCDE